MAMKIENIGGKIIGIGDVTVLPGDTATIPQAFERSPILEVYKNIGMAKISGKPTVEPKSVEESADEKEEDTKDEAEEAEALRKARLASLRGISEEGLASLAKELGINPAECKDQADVLKKVKAALKK